MHYMDFAEYANTFALWRFVLRTNGYLMGWDSACKFARTPNKIKRVMQKVGKKQGANPAHWFALSTPVSVADVTPEIYQPKNGAWVQWHKELHNMPAELAEGQRFERYSDVVKTGT